MVHPLWLEAIAMLSNGYVFVHRMVLCLGREVDNAVVSAASHEVDFNFLAC